MERGHYFECSCRSPEHTLRFWIDEDDPPILAAYVFLGNNTWFRRVWSAIKYVFGYRCRYGHFDEFILQQSDADRLIALLTKYKELHERQ